MRTIKSLFFMSLALTFASIIFNVFAADKSICNSSANVVLHNNGSLQSCQLKDDYDANKVTCKNGGPVSFYSNGKLESCQLKDDSNVNNIRCKNGGSISFYSNSKL